MAICTAVSGSTLVIQNGVDASVCSGPVLLSAAEYTDFLAQLTAFGFDQDLFNKAFLYSLLIFVSGLGVGLVISQLRKARV